MENKYVEYNQNLIDYLLGKIKMWKNLFSIKYDYFLDGWAVKLREKNTFPRSIIIFHSYNDNLYSIKSFEIKSTLTKKEEYTELYSKEYIDNIDDVIRELNAIIYGKDLLTFASKKLKNELNQNSGL